MTPSHAANERLVLQSQIRFHRTLSMILAVGILVMSIAFCWVLLRETTHLVPVESRRLYEVGAGQANTAYLQDMAEYVLSMVMTVTPENVDHNNSVILKMADPDGYGALKVALDAAALRVKQERVATVWVPQIEEVNTKDLRVRVSGKLKTYIADKLTSEKPHDYLVEFIITPSGRLYVSKIEEVIKPAAS